MSYHREDLPGAGALTVASIFPAAVIAIELTTGLCAGVFFDPMPTVWHLLLVAFVPVCNVLLWRAVRGASDGTAGQPIWLVVAAGAAVCVAASYTLLFLPMLPMALIAVPFGVGLLPFAPLAGLVFALRWSFAVAATRHGGGRLLFAGLALGAAALVVVDLRVTMTQVALDRYGGDADARASAVGLMRAWGDPALLLRQYYGDSGRSGGIGSFLASAWTNGTLFGERPRTADGRVFAVTDLAVYTVAIVMHRSWITTFDQRNARDGSATTRGSSNTRRSAESALAARRLRLWCRLVP